jgi:hypothetical protein
MSDPATESPPQTPQDIYSRLQIPVKRVPKPEDIYNVPVRLVNSLVEMAPKLQASGAWWSLGGDLGENMLDVHVRPTEIEILTNGEGLERVMSALSEYHAPRPELREWKLEREAEPGLSPNDKYPVFARSTNTRFTAKGANVIIHSDYQMKVGEWEWGDTLFFDPVFINVASVQVPLMPLRLRSEIYLVLGWDDRAKKVSEAFKRSHAYLPHLVEGFGTRS